MRTAEEIIESQYSEGEYAEKYGFERTYKVIQAINEARKEAIEECAKIASDYVLNERTPDYDDVHFLVTKLIKGLK